MIEILELPSGDELADLRRAYLASLSAPFDGMWEAFVAMARNREIRSAGERVGYFCVNDAGQILQFHLGTAFEPVAAELFAAVVARDEVKGAMVSTADPLFLCLCLDAHEQVEVHTYLYQDHHRGTSILADGDETTLAVVEPGELDEIAELQRQSLDQDPGEWLLGYLQNLIARRELYALRRGGEVLGTGEARVSDSQPPFVDLGVITMQHHRGQGVATHVLCCLKQVCADRDLVPDLDVLAGRIETELEQLHHECATVRSA